MSEYENVVVEKLRLKGKALGVKGDGIRKKKKQKKRIDEFSQLVREDDHDLSAVERRYLRQWEKINLQRMAKMASKSHRDRIQEFNQHLANLIEHHDIPKVGPG